MPITTERNALAIKLEKAVELGLFNEFQALAIYRCCFYHEQIADRSIGNIFRDDIATLLKG